MKILKYLILLVIIFCIAIAIKGPLGDPLYFQTKRETTILGPFEVSNNSSRFALTEAIVKNKSFFLNDQQAFFASPDLTKINDKYISIFTPGVSFLGIPFYLIGNLFGVPQLSSYLLSSLIALVNIYLIIKVSEKIGVNKNVGLISGLVFLFATNAYSYSNSFNQHHISTAILLLGFLTIFKEDSLIKNILVGILLGLGAIVDIPNIFLMIPILIYIFFSHIIYKKVNRKIILGLKTQIIGIILGVIPFISLFAWYNYSVTGNPLTLGQVYGRHIYAENKLTIDLKKTESKNKSDFHQFYTRRMMSSLHVLLLSQDRGVFTYSPIILLGIFGLINFIKNNKKQINLVFLATILINIILYSLFNDPWGGWAFGPRYLIPTYAILSIFVGYFLTKYHTILSLSFFFLLLGTSVFINTLGALTTQLVPSSIQVDFLTEKIPDNFLYNFSLAQNNQSSSLIYNNLFWGRINLLTFIIFVTLLITITILGHLLIAKPFKHSPQGT